MVRCFLILLVVSCYCFLSQPARTQDTTLLLDKTGAFNILDLGAYIHRNCGYSGIDTTENFKKLLKVIDTILTNPVLSNPKGFDLRLLIGSWDCDQKNGYGIPVEMGFDFCSWSLVGDKEVKWNNNPPEWLLETNRLKSFNGGGFSVITDTKDKPKQGFNRKQWEEASDKLNELFVMPGKKETIGRGMDRYNKDFIIVYTPERPSYWLPVTIREAFDVLFDYWRKHPDEATATPILRMLEREYTRFSVEERNGYAYSGDPASVSRIGSDSKQLPVMKVNPAYWNKNMPRSAVQILSFHCPADKDKIRREKEEQMKSNNGNYHLSCFLEAIDLKIFPGLVDR
jgi:hypothetical protein